MKGVVQPLALIVFVSIPLCLPMSTETDSAQDEYLLFDGQIVPIMTPQEVESDPNYDCEDQENLQDALTAQAQTPVIAAVQAATEENSTYKCCWKGDCKSFTCQEDLCDHVSEKHAVKNMRFKNHCKCLWMLENGEICARLLSRLDTFKSHLQLHTMDTPIICGYCSKKFTTERALKSHENNVHNKAQKKYICSYCGETFFNQHFYRKHIAEEENNEPYCLECQKAFATTSTLNTHIRTVHNKIRAYSCDVCDRTFLQSGHLKAHQKKCYNT